MKQITSDYLLLS